MKINYDEMIPEAAKRKVRSVAVEILLEFLGSGHRTMSLSFTDKREAVNNCGTIRRWGKNNARTDFNVYRLGETIYIEKLSKNSKNKSS